VEEGTSDRTATKRGDALLISFMEGGTLSEIAQQAGTQPLNSDREEEPDETRLAEKMRNWHTEKPKNAEVNVSAGERDVDDLKLALPNEAQFAQNSSQNRPAPPLGQSTTPEPDADLAEVRMPLLAAESPRASAGEDSHAPIAEREAPEPDYPIGPATDSGYASMGRSEESRKADEEDDARTVFTDNQELDVPEDVKERLVAAFSGELIQQLQEFLGEAGDRIAIRNALGEFLKEYSLRLRVSACAGEQKHATTFVRHYRL
jgi:hypothetical protein